MYHTWFFQKRLATALDQHLVGATLLACFSQQKDELILGFSKGDSELYMCAHLASDAGFISFKDSFARARKNSVDLFPEVLQRKVQRVIPFSFERSFYIQLQNGFGLVFKMHGQRSNVLLTHKNKVTRVFRNNLPADLEIDPLSLHKTLELTKPNILLLLGKRNHHLFVNEIDSIDHFIKKINQNSLFIGLQDSIPVLKLVPIHDPILVTDDPLIASNKLVELHQQHYQLGKEKQAVTHLLSKQIDQLITYIAKAELKLEEVINQRDPQELANLIMANLHTIPAKAISATLADFYREGSPPITIKLNPNLSAQLSAQHYYRKSKNKRIELEKIEENIAQKKGLLESKKVLLQTAEAIHSLKEIRAFKVNYIDRFKTEAEPLPYHTVMFDGYHILIGKNAKSNDHLTMQIAAKNDLWLHARDVSGSHVIIREKPGQKFPEPVIEKAAQLAAWNSKRKTDSLCPVIYTPRKFVRKIKGAVPGQVVVDKEQVVMVVPTKNAE